MKAQVASRKPRVNMRVDHQALVARLGVLAKCANGPEGIPPEAGRRLTGARSRSRKAQAQVRKLFVEVSGCEAREATARLPGCSAMGGWAS